MSTSIEANPVHVYSQPGKYSVTLTAYNQDGQAILSSPQVIDVKYPLPLVDVVVSTFDGIAPLKVEFTSTPTNAVRYVWDFGNGGSSTIQSPVYVYQKPGTYTVKVTAYNADGVAKEYTLSKPITVRYPLAMADFEAIPLTGTSPLTVKFTNKSVNGVRFEWRFGD
ncbi:MAG: PKD domain-containing protein [Nanoarchaeota archaeon]